jgi:transposase
VAVAENETDAAEPRDLAEARRLISSLQSERRVLHEERQLLSDQLERTRRENEQLKHKLDVLCRRLFGRKSEKVDPSQLRLALDLLEAEPEAESKPLEADSGESPRRERKRRRGRSTGRQALPPELPRQVVTRDVPEGERVCACGAEKPVIGEDVSEKLEYVPASFHVIQTRRIKRACPKGHGMSVGPAPPQAIEKSLAGEGLLAHVVVSKFGDHLPLHRQEEILGRHGVHLPRSTLCNWVEGVAAAFSPIVQHMRSELLATDYLQTDDTPVLVLKKLLGSFKGRLWAYLDPLGRQVVYDATPTHEARGPEAFLADFEGYLQADAYTGYDGLFRSGRIVEVACWTHARRRFREALETDPRAASMLALVQELYRIERDAGELAFEERKALRRDRSTLVLAQIDELRQKLAGDVLPKSPLGEALRYLGNQWDALHRYLEDGRLVIDNNGAENQLRIVAVGRKNWMFAGSLAGARWAATLFSLVQSCRLVGVDPFLYFRDVLMRLPTHPQRLIGQLTPRAWADNFADQAAA